MGALPDLKSMSSGGEGWISGPSPPQLALEKLSSPSSGAHIFLFVAKSYMG